MKLTEIQIDNILGLTTLTLKPGAVNIVTGRNGAGKTSLLEAVRATFRGGHDGSLLRKGAEEGSIQAKIDDGTEIVRKVTPSKSTVDVRIPVVGKVSKPQAVIDSLVDEFGVDPLTIIACPPAKRAAYIAEVMPLELDAKAIAEATGTKGLDDGQGGALDRIDRARKVLYDQRTGVNRSLKDKKATASQLRESLPKNVAQGEDVETLRQKEKAVLAQKSAELEEIQKTRNDTVREAEAQAQKEVDAARAKMQKAIEVANNRREAEKQALDASYAEPLAEIQRGIGAAAEHERARAQAEKTAALAAQMGQEAEKLAKEAEGLSSGIEALDALRTKILESLPIAGLELRGGDVFVDGLPFDRVNTARQIGVAVQVAALRAGKLGLIVVDRAEVLDDEHFAAFQTAAKAANLQLFVARVSEGELRVESQP